MIPKIIPHLWFDREANEAAEFYTRIFPDSKITSGATLPDTPSGDTPTVSFELMGQPFMAISAGPEFKFNPSISFFVNFDPSRDPSARENLDRLWEHLVEGGEVLMPLQEYPFSKHYSWVQDRYGVSWQLILTNPEGEERSAIIPSLLFVGDGVGRAEEAINFYLSVFSDSQMGNIVRHPAGAEPDQEGTVMFADFRLLNQWLSANDSGYDHQFSFNEAISFMVLCRDQAEIDYYWEKLSAVPEAEQCGWLKDRFGVSWQIVPAALDEMMSSADEDQMARLIRSFLKMKKLDLAELQRAYTG
jgi:predicted 3-demethylubiquinone-9 3-methyltransferase (glyoxalase superfamily)